MFFFRRQRSQELDQLVERYTTGGMSRRTFIQSAMALSLTATSASALLAACGSSNSSSVTTTTTTGGVPGVTNSTNSTNNISATTLTILVPWSGDELDSFQHVLAAFEQQNPVQINAESTPDVTSLLSSRIKANKLPDLAILPGPGAIQQFVSQGKLTALDASIDPTQLKTDYSQFWIDLGTYQGSLYAIFYKASNKSIVWYNPAQFQENGYLVPQTWDEMITLSNKIARNGKYPWAFGVADGSVSGWPAADWIAQIFLNQSGPTLYDQWVQHKIPWTHSSVKSAFTYFAQIITGKHFIQGGAQSIIATSGQNAIHSLFNSTPTAYMDYLGDFAEDYIVMQNPNTIPGTNFNYFNFPSINPRYAGAITGGADALVALNSNSTITALIQFLSGSDAQAIWAGRGGYTSINQSVDLNTYPNEVAKASAQQLATASTFRYGAADLMPPAVRSAFLKGVVTFISHPDQLTTVLSSIESTARQSYTS